MSSHAAVFTDPTFSSGPKRAGQKVLTLRGAMPCEGTTGQPLCADIDGFSLHAAVGVEANDCKQLEQLCRSITRPALYDARVQSIAAVQVELKLMTLWRDGFMHRVMNPLEFMQRLKLRPPMIGSLHPSSTVRCMHRVDLR